MQPDASNNQRIFITAGAILAWFSLITQGYLILLNRQASVLETVFRYFGYFTILTNILVALCFSALFMKQAGFFHKAGTQTAIAVYIFVVALIYHTLLRGIAHPQGMDRVADELLHVVMPVIFILYWIFYTDKKNVRRKQAWLWLAYPFAYIIYTLIRGNFAHFYPYPFINVDQLGYEKVLINSLWVSFAFVFVSLLFIAIAKIMSKRQ